MAHKLWDLTPDLWTGAPAVGVALRALWPPYQVHWSAWRGLLIQQQPPALPPALGPRDGRALWQALAPYRPRLPTLRVYLTEYPWPVAALVPPVTVVLGTHQGALTAAQYVATVERAAAALAAVV